MKRPWLALLLTLAVLTAACAPAAVPSSPAPSSPASDAPPLTVKPSEPLPPRVEAQELAEAVPGGTLEGYTLYFRDEATGEYDSPKNRPYPWSGTLFALAQGGEKAYPLGRILTRQGDDSGPAWGNVTVLGNNILCYCNYEGLSYTDMETGAPADFYLDFQPPKGKHWWLNTVVYDPQARQYLLIYSVSGYEKSTDGQVREWMIYQNNPEYGASDAHLEFQTFDQRGAFLERFVTQLDPMFINEVPDCRPNRWKGGTLSFAAGGGSKTYLTWNPQAGAKSIAGNSDVFFWGDVTLLVKTQEETMEYQWLEEGKAPKTLRVQGTEKLPLEPLCHPESDFGYSRQVEVLDPVGQTAVVRDGYVVHELDFAKGTVRPRVEFTQAILSRPWLASPKGSWQLYRVGEDGGGEYMADAVAAKDTATGVVRYLGELVNYTGTLFAGEERLLVTRPQVLFSYDLATGERTLPLEEFVPREGHGDQLILYLLYDQERELFLLLTTPYTDTMLVPPEDYPNMFLRVYSSRWELQKTLDTGLKPQPGKYVPYCPGMSLEGGAAVLQSGEQRTIPYGD